MRWYVPTNGKPPYGLLVAFHGFGVPPCTYYKNADLWEIADETNCVLILPRGRNLNWGGVDPTEYREQDFTRVEKWISWAKKRWKIDDRLFLTGFSDGASFAATLGIEWNEQVTAIAPYAGFLQRPVVTNNKFPVLVCIGVEDRLVSIERFNDMTISFSNEGHFVSTYLAPGGHKWNGAANPVIAKFFNEPKPEPKPDYRLW
jgi:predicted esterase